MVSQLAEKYDYTAEIVDNVVLLQKRYTLPEDIPCVTLAEYLASMEDAVRILGTLSPRSPQDIQASIYVRNIVNSLNSEQIQAMERGTLSYSSLTTAQKRFVSDMAFFVYAGLPRERAEASHFLLQRSARGRLILSDETFAMNVVSLEIIEINGMPSKRPLGTIAPEAQGDDASERRALQALSPHATLSDAVRLFNARKMNSSGDPAIIVDSLLAEKPLLVEGDTRRLSSRRFADSVARLYGLRVVTQNEGKLRITRRTWRGGAITPQNLSQAIRQSLPDPLLRAIRDGQAEKLVAEMKKRSEAGDFQGFNRIMAERDAVQAIPGEMVVRTRKALVAVVTQRVKSAADGVPVKELAPRERSALAFSFMSDFLMVLDGQIKSEAPEWITRLNSASLTGKIQEDRGTRYAQVGFVTSLPNGQTQTHTLIGGVKLP
jgi:hypothetical protein